MAPSIPQGLLAGSKREHLFHLLGIHTQQSLTNSHFIPWPIWSPSMATLVPHHYCGEPPRTHSLHSSSQLDTHKVTQVLTHKLYLKSLYTGAQTQESQSSFMAGIYRQWSCLQLCQVCQSASSSVLTLFGILASHNLMLTHIYGIVDNHIEHRQIVYGQLLRVRRGVPDELIPQVHV